MLTDLRRMPLPSAAAATGSLVEFYVARNGNDSWSGRLPAPTPDRTDGPLATPRAARDAIRRWKASHDSVQPIVVWIRKGTYFLSEPLELTPEDGGTASAPVTYAAYPGETPILSAGQRLQGWEASEAHGRVIWTLHVPEVEAGSRYFRQLFVNGERRLRARMPNEGLFEIEEVPDVTSETAWNEGQTRFRFAEGDLKAWEDADEGEVVALHFWVDSHLPIAGVDEKERVVTFHKRSVFRLTADHGKKGAPYYVENVLTALDRPGEWCLHRRMGTLYYLPLPHERPDTVDAVIPRHSQVVRVEGRADEGRFVQHVVFQGLTFSHTEWWFSPEYAPTWPKPDIGGMVQAAHAVPGAVRFRGARHCRVEGCTIAHVGTYGVELEGGCRENAIVGNTITDLGAGGVRIGETAIREAAAEQTHGNEVTDNVIAGGGRLFHSAVGVWIGHSGGNLIAHNDIHDFYYTGVSVGWAWGYGRSLSAHNRIESNHIHTIGQGWLSDMGAIYTLGVSPGMVIRGNLIHDVVSRGYGGWGIYPDEGTSHAIIEGNVVYRTNRCGFHLHYGKDNLIQNNIFALAGEAQICRSRQDPFVFRRNIVYFSEGDLLGGNWSELNVAMDENLYFDASGRPVRPRGQSWGDWQAAGMDLHSVVADPRFAAPEQGDFRLAHDSPARSIGFEPIDLGSVGPRTR
jgi:parallel beta-helix repeat protein